MTRAAAGLAPLLALVLCGAGATPPPAPTSIPIHDDAPIQLQMPVSHLYVREHDEQAMVDQINVLRTAHQLKPLIIDDKLTAVARSYARAMLLHQFFGHDDPSGRTFIDRLLAAGYEFYRAGENIALDTNDETHAQQSLEQSPPHLHNMLDPNFTRIGIGAIADSVYGTAYVQEFAMIP
jgi:uncharacterized protein YkwD